MKKISIFVSFFIFLTSVGFSQILLEAESFTNKGGWVVDQQFMDVMGSPYLMAHGMGIPVEDATTMVSFPKTGKYYLFVRTRNWAAKWSDKEAPGKFSVLLDGMAVNKVFGTESGNWDWSNAGSIDITKKQYSLSLKDLTGFDGRCDALIFSADPSFIPPSNLEEMKAYRREILNLPKTPKSAGKFDFVVVGGGMAGTCAAISAARRGVKVALIQDRPVLGGNNSSEVRVHLGARINLEPYPALGNLVNEIGPSRGGNAQPYENYEDDKKLQAVLNEKNISLFLNFHANNVVTKNGEIESILAQNIVTSELLVFKSPIFADCTGDGTIGTLAGAEFMIGRESRDVFGESSAPEKADNLTMGASIQWFSTKKEDPTTFPDIKWGLPWNDQKEEAITRGDWNWETGMGLDMDQDFEHIRDYGMLVVYSNWSYLKNHSKDKTKFENEQLKWVAYIGGKRESRRLTGDYVLVEQDLIERRVYPDGTASTSWPIDLHYPDPKNSELFPGKEFKSIAEFTTIYPYPIPFRCLYSKNISNLMMAGRDISVSHVALGTVRDMRTTGMMGEVIGMAASICKNEKTNPRGVYKNYFSKMQKLMEVGVGNPDLPKIQNYNLGPTLLPDSTK